MCFILRIPVVPCVTFQTIMPDIYKQFHDLKKEQSTHRECVPNGTSDIPHLQNPARLCLLTMSVDIVHSGERGSLSRSQFNQCSHIDLLCSFPLWTSSWDLSLLFFPQFRSFSFCPGSVFLSFSLFEKDAMG